VNFPLYIAKRYLISKSSNNAINIITLFAALGVVFATLVLFVVLSGFSGLKDFSIGFYQASDPDIKITASKGKTFHITDSLIQKLKADSDIDAFSKTLEERAFFNYQNKEHIAYIYGVDEKFAQVVRIDTTVIGGEWLNPNIPYGVVTGNSISNKLSLGIDYINPMYIYVPKPGNSYDITNPESLVNSINTQNIGVFAIIDEIDSKYVFAHLPIVQELLGYPLDQISGITIRLKPETNPEDFVKKWQTELGSNFKVQTRKQLNAVFYRMLNTENVVLYFVFTLILVIALFNIIGTIIMMILDKKTNLKTLYSLGVTIPELQKIFVFQGFMLSMFGLVLGLILGIIMVILQDHLHLLMINPNLPYPVRLTLQNVVIVILTMSFLSFLASMIAGKRINQKMLDS
jgi:lipoprotein-releasing system permease protein